MDSRAVSNNLIGIRITVDLLLQEKFSFICPVFRIRKSKKVRGNGSRIVQRDSRLDPFSLCPTVLCIKPHGLAAERNPDDAVRRSHKHVPIT